MDLPTYTNIWRIEKRLYKLYDLRLPMPLPLGQIIAFAGITIPYVLLLTLIGIPFNHNLFWLYVLPPWALTWLATRPVLENKRLPELLASQVRYLSEPGVWCRMAPSAEQDEITVTGKVWHAHRQPVRQPAVAAHITAAVEANGTQAGQETAARPGISRARKPARVPAPGQPQWASTSAAAKRRSEARHRRPAPPQPQEAPGARVQVQVPLGQPASFVPQRAHGDPVRAYGDPARAHGDPVRVHGGDPIPATSRHTAVPDTGPRERVAAPREPAAAPFRSPRHPASRPAKPAVARGQQTPISGQQPEWAKRARPGSWPADPSRPATDPLTPAIEAPAEIPGKPKIIEVSHAEKGQPEKRAIPAPSGDLLLPFSVKPSSPSASAQPTSPVTDLAGPARPETGPIPAVAAPEPSDQHSADAPVQVAAADYSRLPGTGGPGSVWPVIAPPSGPGPQAEAPEPAGQGADVPVRPVAGPPSSPVPPIAAPESAGQREAGPAWPYGPVRPDGAGKHSREPDAERPVAGAEPWVPPVTVGRSRAEERPARTVEQVLGGPAGPRGRSWHERVTLVPGGHGPGRPSPRDQEERDKARARVPLLGPRRVVVLGCTSGAGQTVTTLLVARMLASLRGERVGVLDLNPGEGSLVRRAKSGVVGSVRGLLDGMSPAGPGLELISGGEGPGGVKGLDERDFGRIGDLLAQRYAISLVDPGASAVGRVLAIADQLVLVAPASSDAPRAVSMTREWLEAHDHRGLAANAIMVLNGVSGRSMADVESAEAIVVGRCRAIVRLPWEDQLSEDDGPCAGVAPLRLRARQALTALTGVVVSGLAAGAEVTR